MGNEVQVQKTAGGLTFKLPAHLAARMAAGDGNIANQSRTNQLLPGGKHWALSVNGETKKLTRPVIVQLADGSYAPDPSGEREPVPTVNVVVLDQGVRGRVYYQGEYDEANQGPPDCWSEDSKRPSPKVEKPPCGSCDTCPMAAKGSAATASNPDRAACRGVKMLAVQMCSQRGIEYGIPPVRLKLPPTSIWDSRDEQAAAQGWYAWDNYTKFLAANGAARTNVGVTMMRFADTNHMQMQFKLVDFLDDENYVKTRELADTDEVKQLLPIFNGTPSTPRTDDKPKGKPLPQDDEPSTSADPVFSQTGKAAAEAQAAENAKLKAAAEAAAQAKANADAAAKAKSDKAAKLAAAKAAAEAAAAEAARLAAEEDGEAFDDGGDPEMTQVIDPAKVAAAIAAADAAKDVTPKRSRAKKDEPAAAPAGPVEVPAAIAGILNDW